MKNDVYALLTHNIGSGELPPCDLRQLPGEPFHLLHGHLRLASELLRFHEPAHGEGTAWFVSVSVVCFPE